MHSRVLMKLYDAKGTVRAQSNVRDLVFLTSVGDQALIDLACDSKGTRSAGTQH